MTEHVQMPKLAAREYAPLRPFMAPLGTGRRARRQTAPLLLIVDRRAMSRQPRCQAMPTGTTRHGPMTPVASLCRHSRAVATWRDCPVTLVVITNEADCPCPMVPGSHREPSGL